MLTITPRRLAGKLPYMALKDRIKAAREFAGLTQEELATRVRVSRPAVVMWESGKTQTIEGENLVRTAYATGVDALWLATGEGDMRPLMVRDDADQMPRRLQIAWLKLDDKMRTHVLAITEAIADNKAGGKRYR